ncbi:MAG: hypothetical protein N0A00_06900, partial [Candidatus Bathyarchaeota archaeon]|nr:hypothetical protein [Candidatus Bathyarchaeota archaeon]
MSSDDEEVILEDDIEDEILALKRRVKELEENLYFLGTQYNNHRHGSPMKMSPPKQQYQFVYGGVMPAITDEKDEKLMESEGSLEKLEKYVMDMRNDM